MTCDPNTLSRLSSCIRCLTDAQLMQIKTYLICQWKTLVAGGGSFLAAPTDAQWTWVDSGGGVATASIVGKTCPAGADGFQLGAVASPGNPTLNIVGVSACASSLTKSFNFGDTALAQIRWTLGGVPVSGWSIQKSLAMVLDPVVQALVNNINAEAIGPLDTTSVNALDAFVKGMRSDGIWAKMIEINCVLNVAGAASPLDVAMALLLIGPNLAPVAGYRWLRANFVLADLTVNGLKGNGVNSSANTNLVPSVTFPGVNNVGLTVYCTQMTNSSVIDFGAVSSDSANALFVLVNFGTNQFEATCWAAGGGDGILIAAPNLNGFYSFSRNAANDVRAYFANSTNAFAQIGSNNVLTGTIFGTHQLIAWAALSAAGAIINNTDRRLSFIAAHQGMTSIETKSLFNRVQALRTALGGGFV